MRRFGLGILGKRPLYRDPRGFYKSRLNVKSSKTALYGPLALSVKPSRLKDEGLATSYLNGQS
jgi:hypothetical protein